MNKCFYDDLSLTRSGKVTLVRTISKPLYEFSEYKPTKGTGFSNGFVYEATELSMVKYEMPDAIPAENEGYFTFNHSNVLEKKEFKAVVQYNKAIELIDTNYYEKPEKEIEINVDEFDNDLYKMLLANEARCRVTRKNKSISNEYTFVTFKGCIFRLDILAGGLKELSVNSYLLTDNNHAKVRVIDLGYTKQFIIKKDNNVMLLMGSTGETKYNPIGVMFDLEKGEFVAMRDIDKDDNAIKELNSIYPKFFE